MRLLLTSVLLMAVGCVEPVGDPNDGNGSGSGSGSGSGPGNGMGTAAKQAFRNDVHPAIGKCSGGACHDINGTSLAQSRFYSADANASYDASVAANKLVGDFSSVAPIITHIQQGHKAIGYAGGEEAKILAWLALEAAARNGGNPPAVDAKALLREWSGCMSLANFTAANMPTAWGQLTGNNLQRCSNCHGGGLAIMINPDANTFFTSISTQLPSLLKYFSVDAAAGKVVINTGSFQAALAVVNHPQYNATSNAGMTALQAFYDATMARKTAKTCDPPRIVE